MRGEGVGVGEMKGGAKEWLKVMKQVQMEEELRGQAVREAEVDEEVRERNGARSRLITSGNEPVSTIMMVVQ